MSVVVVTGSAGLVGSEAVRWFGGKGFDVIGIDNDMRRSFFGDAASTLGVRRRLEAECRFYTHCDLDLRERASLDGVFARCGRSIAAVIHTAAQPSHDWAARDPVVDFEVNAVGTLYLLEAARRHCPDAAFVLTSTNKVYGDAPNALPLVELDRRWDLPPDHPCYGGIDEAMSIDQSLHSPYGVSKAAADLSVQEYGRQFGMKTVVFRGGCITGPAHAGVELHGFLSYLMKCTVAGIAYTIRGYGGKQVRDNLHSEDLVAAMWEFVQHPGAGQVYNIGGGRSASCSILEAIDLCQEIAGRRLHCTYSDEHRSGDHMWWISSVKRFTNDYPAWTRRHGLRETLEQIHDACL